ncbi:ATP-binding protein [[Brevibacterium] frigoritolerans]|nr:ATP-binding protein [Peribacillus frigoritolerans]
MHAEHFSYAATVSDDEIKNFLRSEYSRPGATEHLTVGDIIRNFLGALNILHQNPDYNRADIFGGIEETSKPAKNDQSFL